MLGDGVPPRFTVNAYGEVVGSPPPVDQPSPVTPPLKSKVVVGRDGGGEGGSNADTPGKKNRTEHRKAMEGKARGRTPLAFFGGTMFSGMLVVCGAHWCEGLESPRPRGEGKSGLR